MDMNNLLNLLINKNQNFNQQKKENFNNQSNQTNMLEPNTYDPFKTVPNNEQKYNENIKQNDNLLFNNPSIQHLLPLILGNHNNSQNEMLNALLKSNPDMNNLMQILPAIQSMQPKTEIKKNKKSPTFVKVSDYYNNK